MAAKRTIYAVIFIASAAALIITNSAIALFVFACLLLLPVMSFVMLYFASKRVKFDFSASDSCIRGGAIKITMRAGLFPRFLAGYAQVDAEIDNTTFHKKVVKRFVIKDLSFAPYSYDYVGEDSGRIQVRFVKIKLVGLFGICSLGVKYPKFAESLISPVLYEDIGVQLGANKSASLSGENSLPQKGNDHTEIFNVRDYVPGDSLNSVHWKLSGKFDTIKVKEYGSTDDNRTLILADMSRKKSGARVSDEWLNVVLDVAVSVSESLKSRGAVHSVGWFNDGVFSCDEVTDNDDFVQMVYDLMSVKVDEDNAETLFYLVRSPEYSSFSKVILVTASADNVELKAFGRDITVLSVGDDTGESDSGHVRMINVTANDAGSALASCVL